DRHCLAPCLLGASVSLWFICLMRTITMTNQFPCRQTRREFVWEMGAGFTGLALTSLLSREGFFERIGFGAERHAAANPLAAKAAHAFGRAKSVIFLMMNGAPSQVDT